MNRWIALLGAATVLASVGCQKPESDPGMSAQGGSARTGQDGGINTVGPDVGGVTPVTGSSLDSAAGGGVNSAALRKARSVAAGGVGSVNNAQRQGSYGGEDLGG